MALKSYRASCLIAFGSILIVMMAGDDRPMQASKPLSFNAARYQAEEDIS
jgi:hypothetical protein